ncbi:plr-1 [Symbiodinium pilosum]|uniref:RING-type E3 ubiquitin transferase n=1 Tax=Symbiodinium pilosum TaxID=2952 RepID=A0A812VX60_SYMPI|nr:plr-1 [Symbiodinium pilosum]
MAEAMEQATATALVATLAASPEEATQDCAICFQPMEESCELQKLSCGHRFHHACISEWLIRKSSCPLCKQESPGAEPEKEPFHIDMGHQEMASFVNELEDIFKAIHAGIREDYAVALPAITYNLCVSLGYEDEDELEEALGGPLVQFLDALPHFEVRQPQDNAEEKDTEIRVLMRPLPSEDDLRPGMGQSLTFTVSEREDLWRVVLLGPRAQVEIPEIEFVFQGRGSRCVDTVYNMIASAVFNLGDHVQKNRRMGGAVSEEELAKICEKIEQLNILLDLEQPFTFRVQDKQGLSEFKPANGVVVLPVSDDAPPLGENYD